MKLVDAELIKKIAQNTRQTEDQVKLTFEGLSFVIYDTLQELGSKVYLKNIGVFELKERKPRNHKLNGVSYPSKSNTYVSFTSSKNLKEIHEKY